MMRRKSCCEIVPDTWQRTRRFINPHKNSMQFNSQWNFGKKIASTRWPTVEKLLQISASMHSCPLKSSWRLKSILWQQLVRFRLSGSSVRLNEHRSHRTLNKSGMWNRQGNLCPQGRPFRKPCLILTSHVSAGIASARPCKLTSSAASIGAAKVAVAMAATTGAAPTSTSSRAPKDVKNQANHFHPLIPAQSK